MAIKHIIIEGRDLKIWDFLPTVGEYLIFRSKIWYLTKTWGFGDNQKFELERKLHHDTIVIGKEEWKHEKIKGIVNSGFIAI